MLLIGCQEVSLHSMRDGEYAFQLVSFSYVSRLCSEFLWVLHQVAEPLRAMVMGAPLEDARHLTQRYERLRQEAEAQV